MKILLRDSNINRENYKYEVNINGKVWDVNVKNDDNPIEILCPEHSVVEITYGNDMFRNKKSIFVVLFYWILSICLGTGECNPFGLPVCGNIYISDTGTNDITLEVTSTWRKEAFFVHGICMVEKNNHFSTKESKKRWFSYTILPALFLINIIAVVVFLYNGMGNYIVGKAFVLSIPIMIEIWLLLYGKKVMRKL